MSLAYGATRDVSRAWRPAGVLAGMSARASLPRLPQDWGLSNRHFCSKEVNTCQALAMS